MPEATFNVRPRPSRGARALRVGGVAVAALALVGLLVRFLAGEDPVPEPLGNVKFTSVVRSIAQGPSEPPPSAAETERGAITDLLDAWYQVAFVDPTGWDDGKFTVLKDLLTEDARTSFDRDVNALTIGEARTEVVRVNPARAHAVITIYFDGDVNAQFAVAEVAFVATARMQSKEAPPLTISQEAAFQLRRDGDRWIVYAWDVDSRQQSATPAPSP